MLELEVCQGLQRKLARCELAVFEDSGHAQHLDEPAKYVARLDAFLRTCD
jgi:pimeloyl-ACP methyl ester carboxylesterase